MASSGHLRPRISRLLRSLSGLVALGISCFCAPAQAQAAPTTAAAAVTRMPPQPPPASQWQRHWPTFSPWEGVATLAAGVGTGLLFMVEPAQEARWEGGILFDDAVRDATRLESKSARKRLRSLGDLPYYAAPVIPMIIDPLIVSLLIRDDAKTALNLELMSLEAFSYAGFLSFISTRASARERPDSSECRRQADGTQCEVDTESFWSGHTSIAAASAGLVCANHQHLPLWGHPVADAGACILATTGALFTGTSRLMGDRHYATDVLAGFGVGFGVGYAVPTLLHYTRGHSEISVSLAPGGPCTGACLKVAGKF
jgi:membrane-associated phospholipid phosphatase